jgi:Protein of unknown function (DUF1566)
MERKLFNKLGFIFFVMLIFTTSRANAQTTAVGPYYANPSWDQTLPVATRFIVLSNMNNEAVLDRETGLVWQRTVGGIFGASTTPYVGALQLCSESPTGGRQGWRLPSIHELQSLVDPTAAASTVALPTGHPFLGVPSFITTYWTGTSVADFPADAYFISLQATAGPGSDHKTAAKRFWCVRAGGPLTAQ